MDADMKLAQLHATGVLITPEVKSQVESDVEWRKTKYHDRVSQIGVPDKFKVLFSMTRKAEAEDYSRNIVFSEYDLFLLIHNCSQIRFTHRSKFRQYVPEHLAVSDTDRDEMKAGNPKKALRKVHSTLLERKYIHVHLFEYSSHWHCFYFTHQDIEPTSANHWKHGCHLHYVSHLWPNFKKRPIWNKFNKRSTEISGGLHIRFQPFEYRDLSAEQEADPDKAGKVPPWAIIFDPNLANGCGSVPLPVAHLATRGLWMTKMSLRPKSNQ